MSPNWLPPATRYVEQWLGFQMRVSQQPGCAFAVASGGRLVSERAFGVADIATGTALTPRHRFRVASHSKTFTSAAILRLREAGRLRLDDPVEAHLPIGGDAGRVTLAQLLTHSAGLMRDGVDIGHWLNRHPFLNAAELRVQLDEPATLPANERFKYSNLGFGLLGLVIEALTGERYESWVGREIVGAAGLRETTPDVSDTPGLALAEGHGMVLPLGHRPVLPNGRVPTHALAAATGFVSTAADLACFFGQLSPSAADSFLSVDSRREIARRQWRTPHSAVERHYGLGTMSGEIDGHAWFGHGGAFPGYITRTAAVPEWDVSVSILTNAIDGMANAWLEGALHIIGAFACRGAPEVAIADWDGRWWSLWAAQDLVPVGGRVLVAQPALLMPLTDAAEITVHDRVGGTIAIANGYNSHGEPVRRVLDEDGRATRVWLAGAELVPEADLAHELAATPLSL